MVKVFKNKKALSPVVAAIILIAVTVALSIAVAAWMASLSFSLAQTEQITFTGSSWGANNAYFLLTIKNTGSADLSIQEVLVEGSSPASITPGLATPCPLTKGYNITFNMTHTGGFNHGVPYQFIVVTAKGNRFGPVTGTPP